MKKFQSDIVALGANYKTKDIDGLIKQYIKDSVDVSKLEKHIDIHQEFHRIYFKVSLKQLKSIEEQFAFIERNFLHLNDWWHVDQLPQFLKPIPLEFAVEKATEYVYHSHPFARRFGYVLFIPRLVKTESAFAEIVKLLHNDDEYYVVMAEAWLISFLAIYHPQKTYDYLSKCELNYNICGKAIQKICDSYMISSEWKERFKSLRPKLKMQTRD